MLSQSWSFVVNVLVDEDITINEETIDCPACPACPA